MSGLGRADRQHTNSGRAGSRGPMTCVTGVETPRVHRHVPDNPARGKAQGRIGPPASNRAGGCGSQTGAKAQKSNATPKTKSHDRSCVFPPRFRDHSLHSAADTPIKPDENQLGGTRGVEGTGGPGSAEMPDPPVRGSKPAKGMIEPRSAAERETSGRRNVRPSLGKAVEESGKRLRAVGARDGFRETAKSPGRLPQQVDA